MKTSYLKLLFFSLLITGFSVQACTSGSPEENRETSTANNSSTQQMLRHVVFFSFTEEATDETVEQIGQTLISLEDTIDEIQDLEWGASVAEGQEYSHCLNVTFASEEDLNTYDKHPDHQKFIDDFGTYFEKVAIVDYWVNE